MSFTISKNSAFKQYSKTNHINEYNQTKIKKKFIILNLIMRNMIKSNNKKIMIQQFIKKTIIDDCKTMKEYILLCGHPKY